VTTPHQLGPDIVLTLDQAGWLQRTLQEAADHLGHRHEPHYLHHDLNYHAVWLQRRLETAAPHPTDNKEPQL
jgi:hypothetical protein